MNTLYLHYFVEVVDCGSISKAAKKLFLNHSSLIYALNEFEKSVGQQLLIRSKAGISPTETGMRVYQDSKLILELIDSWAQVERQSKNLLLNIKSVLCIFYTFLDDIIFQLAKRRTDLRIFSSTLPSFVFFAERESFDPMTLYISGYYSGEQSQEIYLREKNKLSEIPLFKTNFVLYLNREHPLSSRASVSIRDLQEIILYSDSYPNNKHYELISSFNPKKLFFLPNPAQILSKIANSKRGTILPAHYQGFSELVDPSKVAVIPIDDYDDEFFVSLYFLPDNLKVPAVKYIIDYISSYPFMKFPGTMVC